MRNILLIFVLLFSVSVVLGQELYLKNRVFIEGKDVFLEDVVRENPVVFAAQRELSRLKVAEFDGETNFINLTASTLRTVLKEAQREDINVKGAACSLFRKEFTVQDSTIIRTASEFLRKTLELKKAEIEITALPKVSYPDTNYTVTYELIEAKNLNRVRLKGYLNGDKTFFLNACVKLYLPGFVTIATKKQGELLTINDVKPVETFNLDNETVVSDSSQFLGKMALGYIPQGTILLKRHLRDVPLIARGSIVNVRVTSKNVSLVLKAKARQNGYLGDAIYFENLKTKETFKAKIESAELAGIDLREVL